MLRKEPERQQSFYCVLYDKIPESHIHKKVSKGVDFSFINELLESSYCKNFGRPAKEPEMMMFDLQEEIEETHKSDSSKNEYKLNIAMTISTLKERVVELVMCENKRRSRRILRQIAKALKKICCRNFIE